VRADRIPPWAISAPRRKELLDGLLGRALVQVMREPGATKWICRMCDTQACGRDAGGCPVANEARARWGSA
jgi:hypothetical protein